MLRRQKVLFFISALSGGGAERATLLLANGLEEREFDVSIALERDLEQIYPTSSAIPIVQLDVQRARAALAPLVTLLRATRPDVVYAVLPHLNALAAVACRLVRPRPRVVVSVHNNLEREYRHMQDGQMLRLVTPHVYRMSDAIVAVSHGVGDQVRQHKGARNKVEVIYDPVDIALVERGAGEALRHRWLSGGYDTVVAMGRLVAQKDYPLLLRSFVEVYNARQSARLVILGGGDLLPELSRMSRDLGVSEYVDFAGVTPNPFAYLARSSCFVSTSQFEGFGMAIVEAMAAGAPVVATDCPYGPAEILAGGRWGVLARVGSPSDVSAGILKILSDSSLRTQLARNGRVRARDFSSDVVVAQLVSLLRRLRPQCASAQFVEIK